MTYATKRKAGPWHVHTSGKFIVTSGRPTQADTVATLHEPQGINNAHLIAAAPESHKANLSFIDWTDSGERGFPDADMLDKAVKAARAAIAKTENRRSGCF